MRLHLVSLPHTETTDAHLTCAYTQKVVKFSKMMTGLGYEVVIYGGEENDAECFEHVPIVSRREQVKWFGEHDFNRLYPDIWDPTSDWWRLTNKRAVKAIREHRADHHDLVLLTGGCCQELIAMRLKDMTSCEPFVGYKGIFSRFRAFESVAWRHWVYGDKRWDDGAWYDVVIPPFVDADDFVAPPVSKRGDYLLFLGRICFRKGPDIASEIAEAAGRRLIIAGNGGEVWEGRIHSLEGNNLTDISIGPHAEFYGPADKAARRQLMSEARALIMPTRFIEPGGNVAIEAMMSGTPVIAPDWGVFTETVVPGYTGERFMRLPEAVEAIDTVASLRPAVVRKYAVERWSLEAIGKRYDRWFRQLNGVWGGDYGAAFGGDWYGR